MTEDKVLLLISSKLSFYGVVTLKVALDHVPHTYKATSKGAIRYSSIADIMNKKGFSVSPIEVRRYLELLEQFCKTFLSSCLELGEIPWKLTEEKDCRFNKFISPPVECCLKCDESLIMHNRPTNPIVYGATGPLPASKVTLECKACKITYGVGHFSDESGRHFYPKEIQLPLIEASNVTYMDKNFYNWIPSLG